MCVFCVHVYFLDVRYVGTSKLVNGLQAWRCCDLWIPDVPFAATVSLSLRDVKWFVLTGFLVSTPSGGFIIKTSSSHHVGFQDVLVDLFQNQHVHDAERDEVYGIVIGHVTSFLSFSLFWVSLSTFRAGFRREQTIRCRQELDLYRGSKETRLLRRLVGRTDKSESGKVTEATTESIRHVTRHVGRKCRPHRSQPTYICVFMPYAVHPVFANLSGIFPRVPKRTMRTTTKPTLPP